MSGPHASEDWGHEDCYICEAARAKASPAYAAGFKAGAEAMREAAAALFPDGGMAQTDADFDARAARMVRALPLPEPK